MYVFKEIFFDCDGTLVDSEIIAMRVAGEALANGLKAVDPSLTLDVDEVIERYAGWHFDQMIAVTEMNFNVTLDHDAIDAEKVTRTLEELRKTQPVPGMADTLDALPGLNYEYSLVTSSEFSRVNLCLEVTGLDVYFPEERKFSAHDTLPAPKHKPHPDIYLHALQARGRNADEVAAVEDSTSGVRAAVAANIFTIGYVGGSHIAASAKEEKALQLMAEGAKIVITDMRDLPLVALFVNHPDLIDNRSHGLVYIAPELRGISAQPAAAPQPGPF